MNSYIIHKNVQNKYEKAETMKLSIKEGVLLHFIYA